VPELINLIAQFLYDQPPGESVRLAPIYDLLPGRDEVEIGEALNRMRQQLLVEASSPNDLIRLSLAGRQAWNDHSVVEQTLGLEYVCELYSSATVHIIVTGDHGESGGSGFFSADHPGWIVTADHVLRNRDVLRIANRLGETIALPPFEKLLQHGAELGFRPDLALVRCDCPTDVNPIRIEWRPEAIRPMDRLLVLGYPSLPGLRPQLDHVMADLRQVGTDFRNEWESLVISSVTLPGSSGEPVLSRRGKAIGVVERENIAERLGEAPVHTFTASPARYLGTCFVGALD
jgi:S1-C subfamily serine protease